MMNTLVAEAGLVHGAGLQSDGINTVPSRATLYNAEKAVQLFKAGYIGHIICSGNGPLVDAEYQASEASLMADVIMAHGINHSHIDTETESRSTLENWVYSTAIIKEFGHDTVLGISDKRHMRRALLIGEFISARSDFILFGYEPARTPLGLITGSKELGKELYAYRFTKMFLRENRDTPIAELPARYQAYKDANGITGAKKAYTESA